MTLFQMFQAFGTWVGAVAAVGGSSAAIAYALFRWLGAKWLDQHFNKRLEEMKHEQQIELERLKHEINSLFSRVSKIHEKEFEVLPQAWNLLQQAHGAVFGVASPLKQYPEFSKMSEQQFEEFVGASRLAEYQKTELRASTDRLKYYQQKIIWVDLGEARKAQIALNNYLAVNSIFMTEELRQQFKKINQALDSVIIGQEIGNQGHSEMLRASSKTLGEISGMFNEIESAVQKRLRYEEA